MKLKQIISTSFLIAYSSIFSLKAFPEPSSITTQNNWEIIQSEVGLFTIQMPSEPQQQTKTTEILGQVREWQLWQIKEESDLYAVAYLELSPTEIAEGSIDAFTSLKMSILEPLNLDELNLDGRSIYLNGYPGMEFIGIQSGKIVAIQIYLVGERLYGILVKSDDINIITQYFNSFQVEPFWESVISESGNFEIKLPELPTEETSILPIGEKELIWNLYRATDLTLGASKEEQAENIYGVGYAELPENWNQQERDNLLNRVGISLLERFNLQLLGNSGREITHAEHSGVEFMGIKNGKIFALRVYEVNNRLYTLFTASNELIKVEKFFQSFQLL
ncbi:hypothetical protein [Gloeocapsa sp. PCC 73106]|uniref:hypothetical protein n=1 Tax=Gloeocapsa sp. PCC 73106 TaxID=102232 RepID=UPI0002AC24D9|nr:hypothetical protein [Gloeocapsa sp. PCC 73106]ELR99478.1 hypothetical protein GLO73106DRAFT_00033300 [Gloeocapsa sp. PCC 73106]